jgi:hypothetical protein
MTPREPAATIPQTIHALQLDLRPKPRLHPHRTSRRHRHHRDLGWNAFAGVKQGKEKATGAKCINNLKQLGLGWTLYAGDSDGRLIVNRAGPSESWVMGNMNMTGTSAENQIANTNPLTMLDDVYVKPGGSPSSAVHANNYTLGRYVSMSAGVFKCPADKSYDRGTRIPRVRSVSMNQGVGFNVSAGWLPASAGWKVYRRDVDISARTFVFVDEHPQSMNDGGFAVRGVDPAMPATWGIVDFPAVYHNKASSFNFGDGHAEIRRWQDGRTTRLMDYGGPQITGGFNSLPNNVDSLWLSQAATE